MSDLDDLLGVAKPKPARRPLVQMMTAEDIREAYTGVTITWLMQAFQMSRQEVRRKLAGCAPIRYDGNNKPIYDFREAASYLVKPKINVRDYIRQLKPKNLPNELQTEYWSARLKQQTWEVKAGQLWRTQDVVDLFGEVFKAVKTSAQLFPDVIERESGLTEAQRVRLVELVDTLQQDIYERLVAISKQRSTPSSAAYLDDEVDTDTDEDEDEDADA